MVLVVCPKIMVRLISMMRTTVVNHNGWVLCSFCSDLVSQSTAGNSGLQVVLFFFGDNLSLVTDKQIIQMMKMTSLQVHTLTWTALTIQEG